MKKFIAVLVLLLVIAAAAYGWMVVRGGFSARSTPSKAEEWLARMMRNAATPARVKEMKNPVAASPEHLREAMAHFADHCAVCHNNNGDADTQFGRSMYPKPPDLRQPNTQNLTDGEIYSIIQNGIRLTGMPAFGSGRDDDQSSWKLVHFIRHLPQLTADEEAEMKRLNPKSPEEWAEQQETEDFLNQGQPAAKSKAKTPKSHH